MKRILDYISTVLCIIVLSIALMYGITWEQDVTIIDYTPEFELSEFPLESVLYLSNDFGSGSGVLIAPNKIITARHVIEGNNFIDIRSYDSDNTFIRSSRLFAFNECDMGIVTLEKDILLKPIPLGDSDDLKIGDTIYCIGYPWGVNTDIVTKGIVSGLKVCKEELFGDVWLMVIDASCQPGYSGGAAINDKGELIGIVVGYRGTGGYWYIIPINIFKQLDDQF